MKGLITGTAFEWNLDSDKEAWSRRYFKRMGMMPNMNQAGTYSAVLHYLEAVKASGKVTGRAVIDQMKRMKPSDMFAKTGYVRPDGLHVHDMYLVRIKPSSEAKEPWDFYDILATIPGEVAFGTPDTTDCPFVKDAAAINKQ